MIEFIPTETWLVAGFALLVFELFTPAIGFLFLGIGALTCAVIFTYYKASLLYQIAAFGIASLAWFLALWWPLKRYVYGDGSKSKLDYFSIAGSKVKVKSAHIEPGRLGQVYWSGTAMNASLQDEETQSANKGEMLEVVEVRGNVLICKKI